MRLLLWLAVLTSCLTACGCASANRYFYNRGRDALDVFTLCAGVGTGARGRVGPLHAGLYMGFGCVGLRRGGWTDGMASSLQEFPLSLHGEECYSEDFYDGSDNDRNYRASSEVPFVTTQMEGHWRGYFTQIEVNAGLGVAIHAGVNPGELLDFLLGLATVDLADDDKRPGRERNDSE